MRIILFSLLTFSLLFGDDNQGYVFEWNFQNDLYIDMESMVEFTQGQYNYYMLFSARLINEFEEPSSSGETILNQSFQNVISSSRRNDEMKPNHDAQKLSGTSYTLTIDSLGYLLSTVGNSDLAKEVLEESDEVNWLFGVNSDRDNIKYFLGGDTLRNEGDVWFVSDTTNEVKSTYGFDDFKGSQITKTSYKFKKLKKKGEDLIAYIDLKSDMEIYGIGTTWDKTIEFSQVGEFKGLMKFNITSGFLVSNKINGALKMKGMDLSDDSSWNVTVDIALKQKGKIK